ncbi:hypothetical protein JKP88DRAFT_189304, partial [Tribonema minus]
MVKGGHRPHISLFHLFLKAVAAKCGAKEAWRLLALMRQSGTQPDVMAYNLALRSRTTLQSADLLLKEMVDAGVAPDRGTYMAMLRACRMSRDMPRALELFAQMEATNLSFVVFSWNSHSSSVRYQSRHVLHLLALMRQSGTKPDVTAYNLALRAQTRLQSADWLLKEMVDAGVAPDRGTYMAMLRACRMSRDMPRALELFAQMEATNLSFVNVHMWNMLLRAIIASGDPQSALQKATEMTQRGVAPDSITYSLLLAAHAALGDEAKVDSLVSQMSASGVEIPPAYYRWVIEGYAQGGLMQRAEDTLEATLTSGTFRPDMAIALLWKYSNAGNLSRVLFWLQRLSASGHKPNPSMWNAAIDAAHKAGDTDTADALWRDAEAAGGLGVYKGMRRNKGGVGWHVVRD